VHGMQGLDAVGPSFVAQYVLTFARIPFFGRHELSPVKLTLRILPQANASGKVR
jgi:hypothetical protein